MRVAFLTHEPFYPPSGGGSAEAVYLVREFVRRGHAVHVFSPPASEPDQVERDFGVRLHAFTKWSMGRTTRWRSLKYLLYPPQLQQLVLAAGREAPFNLVLSQHTISAVAAGRLRRRLGVPVVMNYLDFLTGFMETWPVWLMPPPALAALKRYELALPRRFAADGVLTVSDPLADRLAAAGMPRDRLCPVYYGYDAGLFAFDEATLARRSEGPPMVVMHGSFDHHHLGPIAREAVIHVNRARPDVRFRFVGPRQPALEELIRQLGRRGIQPPIECTGFIPYREVADQLASATVGLVPYEASSGVHCAFVAKAVEYLGLGLPVVSTALEALQRYFTHEPLIRFADFDGRAFGEQILAWLTVPPTQLATWGRAASDRVRGELDWTIVARRAVDFVELVASRRQDGAP